MPGLTVITNSRSLLKIRSIESVMPSNHLTSVIPFSSCLQSFPASGSLQMSQFFTCRCQNYWSLSFSISPSNEYSGLISFRMDLLAVQGTLKGILQHHSSKASILQCSAFFIVQLSHRYISQMVGFSFLMMNNILSDSIHFICRLFY